MNYREEGEIVLESKISRVLKSIYILLAAIYSAGMFFYVLYSLIFEKTNLLTAIFMLLFIFFVIVQTSLLGLWMPFSVGTLFLVFGLATFVILMQLGSDYRGSIFLISACSFFFISGTLLIFSRVLEKSIRK